MHMHPHASLTKELYIYADFFYTSGRIWHTFDATYHALADVY